MALINDYKQPIKLTINGREFDCSRDITYSNHVFNNSGSSTKLKNVYPVDLEQQNGNRLTPFKLDKYSIAIIYVGNTLFDFGVVKVQKGGSLNRRKPKHINLNIVSYKEWLTKKFMDFPILNATPEYIVNKVITTLNNDRIKVGTLSFGNKAKIISYNTKSKTAWEVLKKLVEPHTNSMLQILTTQDGSITINFYDRTSILGINNGNKGIDMDLSTDALFTQFDDLYKIEDIEWAENNLKSNNFVRIDSEGSLSTILQKEIIDLTQGQSDIILPFNVGQVDRAESFVEIDNNRRKIFIETQDNAARGKNYDVSYSINSNTISLNERLLNRNGTLQFSYRPIIRQTLDFTDSNDQAKVATLAGGGDGILAQYEKHNDLTETKDMIALGNNYLENGTDEKIKLIVTLENPAWELGQHVNYKGELQNGELPSSRYSEMDGEYIVREVNFRMSGADSNTQIERTSFEYHLVKSQDLENEQNFYDKLIERDNPILNIENVSTETTRSIDQRIYVLAKDLVLECPVIEPGTISPFQSGFQVPFGNYNNEKVPYKIIDLGGSS